MRMTMTGSAATSVVYEPDGMQIRFPVPFPVFHADDIHALEVDGMREVRLTNFEVEGIGTEEGVHVRFFSPPTYGNRLVLYRWTKRVQESDYPEGGRFPAKVVETDFDRLVGMAQEVDDQLEWTLKIPRGSGVTPIDYTEGVFAAAEEAASSARESVAAATEAREKARDAADQAAGAARMAESAAQSAQEAAGIVNEGVVNASETLKGLVRFATKKEHQDGAANLAATPEHVKAMLDARGDSVPLLKIDFFPTTLPPSGWFRVDAATGQLAAEAWPQAASEVYRRYAAGDAFTATEEAWQADIAANGGVTSLFSIGDGSTWFRVPVIEKRVAVSAKDSAAGVEPGMYLHDRMRPITGKIGTGGSALLSGTGAFQDGELDPYYRPAPGSSSARSVLLNTSLLGEPYSGDKTHGPRMVWVPYIKLYGAVTEAGEANMAALVTGLPGKVDRTDYDADRAAEAWAYPVAMGVISANGTPKWVKGNVAATARASKGYYRITFAEAMRNSDYAVFPASQGNSSTYVEAQKTTAGFAISRLGSDGAGYDGEMSFAVYYGGER